MFSLSFEEDEGSTSANHVITTSELTLLSVQGTPRATIVAMRM